MISVHAPNDNYQTQTFSSQLAIQLLNQLQRKTDNNSNSLEEIWHTLKHMSVA